MMIVKTAVCVGNDTWLPQVSCGGDDCTVGTDSGGTDSGRTYSTGTFIGSYVANYIWVIPCPINTKK